MAYATPYVLTKIDLAAMRKADYLTVRFNGSAGSSSGVHAIRRAEKTERDPFATEQAYKIAAPVRVYGFDYKPDDAYRVMCFEMMWLYHNQGGHTESVLSTLRSGDGVIFEFYPDYHSNCYMAKAGLHGDALRLHVWRGDKQVAVWELASQACPDNSARMCKGIGTTETYKRNAERV